MTLGLLLFEFKDAIKEGDGDRCLCLWKYFLLVFKASGRKNYAKEAFHLLIQSIPHWQNNVVLIVSEGEMLPLHNTLCHWQRVLNGRDLSIHVDFLVTP